MYSFTTLWNVIVCGGQYVYIFILLSLKKKKTLEYSIQKTEVIHISIPFLWHTLDLKEVWFTLKEQSQLQDSFLSYILELLSVPEFRGTLVLCMQCDFWLITLILY